MKAGPLEEARLCRRKKPVKKVPEKKPTVDLMEQTTQICRVPKEQKSLPGTRLKKINEAKKKVLQNFYDRPEVQEKIAIRFLEEMGLF